MSKRKMTSDAVKILDRMTGNDRVLRARIEQERVNLQIAQLVYDARTAASMTQRELAEAIGTKQPVIARLEDADYDGHSLTMLQRIAKALGRELEIRMLPRGKKPKRPMSA